MPNTTRIAAAAGAAAAAITLLAGCSSSGSPAAGPVAAKGSAATGGGSAGSADDGTLHLEITSGPHAGSHDAKGLLQCHHGMQVADAWWINFTVPDEVTPGDVALLNLWLAPESKKDDPNSPYRGKSQILDLAFDTPIAQGGDRFSVGSEVGGTLSADGQQGNTVRFTAKTADGNTVKISASCSKVGK